MTTHKKGPDAGGELAAIEARIAELKERAKLVRSRSKVRSQLVAYCKKRGLTRSDLLAAVEQMPLVRITKRSRLERIETESKNKRKSKRTDKA